METQMWCVIILTCVCLSQAALPLPPYVKPCALSDPDFKQVRLEERQGVDPSSLKRCDKFCIICCTAISTFQVTENTKCQFWIPSKIKEIKIADGGPVQAGLTLVMKDAKVYGMKTSFLEDTNFDFDKKHIKHVMLLSRVEIIGKYDVNGRILLLPITGNGDINITLDNARVTYDHDYTLDPIDGDVYMVIKNPKAIVVPEKAHIHLTNLFNGDPVLGNQMNIFLEENWRDVYKELSPAVFTAFTEIVTTIITGIAGSVPFAVGFPEKLP